MRMIKFLTAMMILLSLGSVARAASVQVTMNEDSRTMSLVSKSDKQPINIGSPDGYIYTFETPPGEYILVGYGEDGTTVNGSISFEVEDKQELQEFRILTTTAYCLNQNADESFWTMDSGDYTMTLSVSTREGVVHESTIGKSTTPGRNTFLAFDGNTVYVSFVPSPEHAAEGYTTYYTSSTLTGNTNLSALIPKGKDYVISVPKDAWLQVGLKFTHYVDFTILEPKSTLVEGDNKRVTYFLADEQQYNIRTSMEGKLTRAGYFYARGEELKFTTTDYEVISPSTIYHDVNSNEGYETGDIFVNINPQGFLSMKSGEVFKARGLRSWQLTDTQTENYFMEPDFHYSVINLDGSPANDIVEITQKQGSAWANIKALKKGTVIVLVTYDAIGVNKFNMKEANQIEPYMGGQNWGAIWPENTATYVISIDNQNSKVIPNFFINQTYNQDKLKLAGDHVDAEHDVFYYIDSEEGHLYTFQPENVNEVSIAYPIIGEKMATYAGFGNEGVTKNPDGTYSLLLKEGRQIVKLTDDAGNSTYQVLTAKPCHREISNISRPTSDLFIPGDEIKIQYTGLRHPANKMSGIYNMSAYVTYNGTPNGTSLILGPGQYTFGSAPAAQEIRITIPSDIDIQSHPEFVMDEGVIQVNGYGDPIGNHRNIDPISGRSANFTAVPHLTYFGYVPDIKLTLSSAPSFKINVICNVSDAEIKIIHDGDVLTPNENGEYSGSVGDYTVTAGKSGYRCFHNTFNIADNAEGIQTFNIELIADPNCWDGKTLTEPQVIEGIRQITTGSELAWFASKHNTKTDEVVNNKATLLNDIDLGDYEWTPIGGSTMASSYKGVFDGNGFNVKGLYIDNPKSDNQGLFGYTRGTKASPVIIQNLSVYGFVKGKAKVAGIVSYAQTYASIVKCANHASVEGSDDGIGGVAGELAANELYVTDCYNTGNISGSAYHAGIVGKNNSGTIKNVFNIGEIENNNFAAACVGWHNTDQMLSNAYAEIIFEGNENCIVVSSEQMASGEVAYKLGQSFGQQIGEEPYPVIDGSKVYYNEAAGTYYNLQSGIEDVIYNEIDVLGYYNVQGLYSDKPFEGFNIVKLSDGSVRKVFVR